jgi:hypothetical protein
MFRHVVFRRVVFRHVLASRRGISGKRVTRRREDPSRAIYPSVIRP